MKSIRFVAALGLMTILGGCTTPPPISSNPVQGAANVLLPKTGPVVIGLQNAAWNLDQAIAIKVLPATDPADACLHSALQTIGADVGQAPIPSSQFTPRVTDLISAGSVAYILAQQAKQLAGNAGSLIPASCEQLVGHFVLAGVNAPANAVISGLAAQLP